jgi:transposase
METTDITQLKALIADQHTLIGQLRAENAELRARLSKNSTNSHKPPTSDGLAKKPSIQPALPKQAGKKQGGQVGHKGDTLHLSQTPDQIIVQQASHCQQCGLALQGEGQLITRRQVFDLPKPRLEVVEYQLLAHTCGCGCVTQGQFPPHVKAPVQYGPRLKATSLVLNADYRIPLQKLSDLWQQWVGQRVNTATLLAAQAQLHGQLEPIETHIKEQIIAAPVSHHDETGVRVAGKLNWGWVTCTSLWTYLFIHAKRGKEALQSVQSIYEQCVGWTVHDCWAAYFALGKGRHALCGAHLVRELQALHEGGRSWAGAMQTHLLVLYKQSREGPLQGAARQEALAEYSRLLELGHQQEYHIVFLTEQALPTGQHYRSVGYALLQRLEARQAQVLAFALEPGVPFSNNQAERDLRHFKVKQRVSNCFRTESGAARYARLSGFLSTMRKQGHNVFEQLTAVSEGTFAWPNT